MAQIADVIGEIEKRRKEQILRLLAEPDGLTWCHEHTNLVDEAILAIFHHLQSPHPALAGVDIVATGGYGRCELAPYSDVDLTLIPPDESSPELDRAIRAFFQELHRSIGTVLGLGIGYAYRLISDAPGLDAKSRTGLVDARLLAGQGRQFMALNEQLDATMAAGEFILAKIKEREAAFARTHETPLVVEPHLKEGAGGLRCFHCANWIRQAIGEREAKPTRAFEHIIRTRNILHAIAGKPQDLLTRSRQEELFRRTGRDPDAGMSDITLAACDLHRNYQHATEQLQDSRFSLSRSVLYTRGEARILDESDAGESAVGIAMATALGLRVSDLQPSPGGKTSGAAAAYAVSTGEATLRNLDKAGLLEHLLPELTRCRTLMPRDNVHRYTVFEHTLQVVRWLDHIPPASFLADIRDGIHDLEPLYLAALVHDIGKFDESRPHSETGSEMAAKICERWHLSQDAAEIVRWLVAEHLTMMRFIRLRDLQNPETIREFTNIARDRTHLDLLTLLTWADVNAVAPGAWTSAQESFLQDLHRRTSEAMEAENPVPFDAAQHRQRLMRQLREEVPEADLGRFVESLPPYYLASTPPNLVKLHYQLVKKAQNGESTVEAFTQNEINATDITVCTRDAKGLLSRLLGIFYAFDLSVSGIRACTTETDDPVALDTFTVSYGGRPVPNATRASISSAILAVLKGERLTADIMRERGKDPDRDQEDFSYTFIPGTPAVLEVRAPRGRGMPYRFSRLIAAQGWNTFAARVGQWADSAAATFYIGSGDGERLTKEAVEAVLGKR
ncbi:MAG: HD domain-containing protein [Fimbriimonadaceae bacterium]|nr:HD domain-containing protein [Fimbriimonadaceae bacterium]